MGRFSSAAGVLKAGPARLAGWCLHHKIQAALVLVCLIALVAWGLYERQRRWEASFDFALLELNTAIATDNLDVLAKRVDFRALSKQMAEEILVNMDMNPVGKDGPQRPETLRADPDFRQTLESDVQKTLIRLFTEKPAAEPVQAKKEAPRVEEIPAEQRGPMYDKAQTLLQEAALQEAKPSKGAPPNPDTMQEPPVLPSSLLTQLKENPFTVEKQDDSSAVVTTKVTHPQANLNVTLRLRAVHSPAGWLFNQLDGVGEMTRAYTAELNAFHAQREALFHARNASMLERMNRTAKILDCTAMLGVERPDGSVVMILRVEGLNSGDETFSAASITCRLFDAPESEAMKQSFGLTQTVKPGANFRINYVQDFEADDPFTPILRSRKTLTCLPQINSITLTSGKLLYVKPFSAFTEAR